jgi:TatD DNase family protein
MLVDSHCHLDFDDFSEELDEIIDRARARGVGRMLTISTHLDKFPGVLRIAERYDDVFCSVGVHPHEAEHHIGLAKDRLIELSQHAKVVGIGETGLDYFYEHSPREAQRDCFRAHIQAARETGLPVIVHTRDADDDTLEILTYEMQKGAFTGLIHCFSSSLELAQKSVEMGLMISISGIVTFKKATELQEAVSQLPLSSLLVETDAPFLAPIPHRGRRNEPSFVADTAAKVAEIKGIEPAELHKITGDNFFRLFAKVPTPT